MRAAKGTMSFAVLLLVWTLGAPRAEAAGNIYLDVSIDVIQVKLGDEASGGVPEDEILGFGDSFKARFDGLATKGKATVLARFQSGITTEAPAKFETVRKVITVTPLSVTPVIVAPVDLQEPQYQRFQIEEVGSSLDVGASPMGDGSRYTVTVKGRMGNVVGWMKDGNPIIVESSLFGVRTIQQGKSLVFSAIVGGDDRELDRDPTRDFTTEQTENALPRPSQYQFLVIVTVK